MKNVGIFGVDTETLDGEPHTLQLYNPTYSSSPCSDLNLKGSFTFCNKETSTYEFLRWVQMYWKKYDNLVIYGFNLRFDLPVLFFKYYDLFVGQEFFEVYDENIKITILYAQNCFAILQQGGKTCYIIDVRNFFRTGSLEYLAEFYKLSVKKLEKPEGLGERKLTEKDIPYAMRDAELTYLLGKIIWEETNKIMGELTNKLSCNVFFSCAGYAEGIFRNVFLKRSIHLPDKAITGSAFLSYHGGRNYYKFINPIIVKNCYEYDIKSAYAWAMTQLPDFGNGKYIWCSNFQQSYRYSILKVKLKTTLPSNLVFSNDGSYIMEGGETWITYPEFMELLQYGDYVEKIVKQVAFIPKGKLEDSPTKRFVEHFAQLRQKAKDENDLVKSEMYKLTMNSLYGKFIQTIAKDRTFWLNEKTGEIEESVNWIAAGLFHPFVATLITGLVRARLLKAERLYNAFHSSTDSIKTNRRLITGENIGDWEEKCFGDTFVLRNRLYIHYNNETGEIAKYAAHGFRGKKEDLEQAIFDGRNEITTNRILWPKEAKRRKLKALKMIPQTVKINVIFTKEFVVAARKIIDSMRRRRENAKTKN